MNKTIRNWVFNFKNVLLPKHTQEESYAYLRERLSSDDPLMVARFGAVEIKAVLYGILPPPICKIFKKYTYRCMRMNAGFFPINDIALKNFAQLMVNDMKQVDILASWRPEEIFFQSKLKNSYRMSINDLQPSLNEKHWNEVLRGKKVLVIHPFAHTIEKQYNQNRTRLFPNDKMLPEFASLQTIQAVQSIAGNDGGFSSWFEALEYMEGEIDAKDFDIALIGCGAYGFPLAAYVKRIGKKAIHIGGALQLFFGIKGKRWDNYPFYNEYWVEPSASEKPKNLEKVEGGCYW